MPTVTEPDARLLSDGGLAYYRRYSQSSAVTRVLLDHIDAQAEEIARLRASSARVEAERDALRQNRDGFRDLAQRYQAEHDREWDQGACGCPRCRPFHDLYKASLGPLPRSAEPAPTEGE